jgi:transposase InsO family protein
METELLSLGIVVKHSRPYHPQTCGKIKRFHQTLKRHLAKQDPPLTKKQLQGQMDRFVAYYNTERPHRAIGRRTPLEALSLRVKAYPTGPKSTALVTRSLATRSTRRARSP